MSRARFIGFFLAFMAFVGFVFDVGATVLRSKVVDAETNEPLEGTVVVVVWRRPVFFPCMDSCSAFHDAAEILTDGNGNFSVDISMGLLANDRNITIYKPGYYLPNYDEFPWLFAEKDPPPKESQIIRLHKAPSLSAQSKGYTSSINACPANEISRFCTPPGKVKRYIQLRELLARIPDSPFFAEQSPQLPRLHAATRAADLETVRSLLAQKANPNEADQDGRTALMWITEGILSNRTDQLAWTERHGGPPSLKEEFKKAYSDFTIRKEAIFRALLKAGANINARTKNGNTALWYAIPRQHRINTGSRYRDLDRLRAHSPDLVNELLGNGANPNIQNNDGVTALMTAASRGLGKIVETLLAHGADVNLKANFALTAYHLAEGEEIIQAIKNARGPTKLIPR